MERNMAWKLDLGDVAYRCKAVPFNRYQVQKRERGYGAHEARWNQIGTPHQDPLALLQGIVALPGVVKLLDASGPGAK